MEYKTNSLEETYELARKFVAGLPSPAGEANGGQAGATVVGLFGDLGAGKTSFTQGVAKAYGVKDHITSPTFVLEKIYKLNGSKYEHLVHIDAYRLEGGSEMSALGWDEVIMNPQNIIFIEWPERVEEVLPKNIIKIYFETGERENERKIKILCPDSIYRIEDPRF
ncbi:MAG: tRNA (adenosine(37)-N6)-threonylcarbamoyltransferase complex ATPase subunit type 1 TsaE [bacterium]|nr:tRNA (adenosine(37)-N6)-threonylcarbamoyltransferase complex ATPase subunit type 1 TsaE [bacterium]